MKVRLAVLLTVVLIHAPGGSRAAEVEIELYAVPTAEADDLESDIVVSFADARDPARGGGDPALVGHAMRNGDEIRSPEAPVDDVVPEYVAAVLRTQGYRSRVGHDPSIPRLHVELQELWGDGGEPHRMHFEARLQLFDPGATTPSWEAPLHGEGDISVVLTDRELGVGYERMFDDARVELIALLQSRGFRRALSLAPMAGRSAEEIAVPTMHGGEVVSGTGAAASAEVAAPGTGWEAVSLTPGVSFIPPFRDEYSSRDRHRVTHRGFLHVGLRCLVRPTRPLLLRFEQSVGFFYESDAAVIHALEQDAFGEEPLVWGRTEGSTGVGVGLPIPGGEFRLTGGPSWFVERLDAGIQRHLEQDYEIGMDYAGVVRMAGVMWLELDGEVPGVLRIGPRLGLRAGGTVETLECNDEYAWDAVACDLEKSQVDVDQLWGFAMSFPAGGPVAFTFELMPYLTISTYGARALDEYNELSAAERQRVSVEMNGWIHVGVDFRLGEVEEP